MLSVGIVVWLKQGMVVVADRFGERRAGADIERACFQKCSTIVCCSEAAGKYQRVVVEDLCMRWLREEASGSRSCSHKCGSRIFYKALFIVSIV